MSFLKDGDDRDPAQAYFIDMHIPGRGVDDIMKMYDETAQEYDQYLNSVGCSSHDGLVEAVKKVMGHRAAEARLIDMCGGTGMSGVALLKAGFRNIDIHDGSQAMLDKARQRGVFKNFYCQVIDGNEMDIPKRTYDVATFCGCFNENHLKACAFRSVIPVVKAGGYIINTMRESVVNIPWFGDGLENYMAKLEEEGLWKKVSHHVIQNYTKPGTGCTSGVIHTYQVL